MMPEVAQEGQRYLFSSGRIIPFAFRSPIVFLVIDKDAVCRTVEILELAVAHGPEKQDKPGATQKQRDRNKEDQDVHVACLTRASLSELPTTTSELRDMATAATSGVTKPASASGTASTL